MTTYAFPPGGHPDQSEDPDRRAIFTESFAVIPRDTMRDIVTSFLPGWDNARMWVLARPMTGFSESFSWYAMEVGPDGGSDTPDTDRTAQSVFLVTDGTAMLTIAGATHALTTGSYAYIPSGTPWSLWAGKDGAKFHWVRKRYVAADGLDRPTAFVTSDVQNAPIEMPGTDRAWATTRFVDPTDLRHDMHVNIVTLKPGARIPFMETHVMEHGLYVLQGQGTYYLNQTDVEVEAGDFMWLRAFCPQSCVAHGDEPFRYLLYKDVNRHMPLGL